MREAVPYSQRELADISGIARSTIAALEAGQRRPQPVTARRLARLLNVEPGEIAWGQRPRQRDAAPRGLPR